MPNRRRSERFAVTLPVVVRAPQGAEKTLTANVSRHGLAVFTDRAVPAGETVSLELSLPAGVELRATATVSRTTERLLDRAGLTHPGLGFRFQSFEGEGETTWATYMERLRTGVGPTPWRDDDEEPPEANTDELAADDPTTTFLVEPGDVARLWGFYRGEMGRGRARIETALLKPVGTPVELLVVHPDSQEEWALFGEVSAASPQGRGRGPMIEIVLSPMDQAARDNFRQFVASGKLPPGRPITAPRAAAPASAPVPPSDPTPIRPPPRAPSVALEPRYEADDEVTENPDDAADTPPPRMPSVPRPRSPGLLAGIGTQAAPGTTPAPRLRPNDPVASGRDPERPRIAPGKVTIRRSGESSAGQAVSISAARPPAPRTPSPVAAIAPPSRPSPAPAGPPPLPSRRAPAAPPTKPAPGGSAPARSPTFAAFFDEFEASSAGPRPGAPIQEDEETNG